MIGARRLSRNVLRACAVPIGAIVALFGIWSGSMGAGRVGAPAARPPDAEAAKVIGLAEEYPYPASWGEVVAGVVTATVGAALAGAILVGGIMLLRWGLRGRRWGGGRRAMAVVPAGCAALMVAIAIGSLAVAPAPQTLLRERAVQPAGELRGPPAVPPPIAPEQPRPRGPLPPLPGEEPPQPTRR